MGKRKLVGQVLTGVRITDAGSEGKGVGRKDDRVIFVPFTAPGDEVDVVITKQRRNYLEARIREFRVYSADRAEPPCAHFGTCGGCRWQHLPYETQLRFKNKVVIDNLRRIGGLEAGEERPILGSARTEYYRNKLEYTFSSRRWFETPPNAEGEAPDPRALGFHMPGMFDRVLDIRHCHLQADPSNAIRLAAREIALEMGLSFYDTRNHEGFFRNLIIRNTDDGQVMVVLVTGQDEPEIARDFLERLSGRGEDGWSLWYIINTKHNDSIADLEPVHFSGPRHLVEEMEGLRFRVGPKSFFQTNSGQALELYRVVREFAALDGTQDIYDLYCGTGTIALFLAGNARSVTGVEYVEEAVADARENAVLNGISNATFVAGDLGKMFDEDFVSRHGRPDVVVTDPPRAGMHPRLVEQLLTLAPSRIIYVSCNPATQARDCEVLAEKYSLDVIQPVDMFPHTHHVENVALLTLNT